jgi:hypothetical protein
LNRPDVVCKPAKAYIKAIKRSAAGGRKRKKGGTRREARESNTDALFPSARKPLSQHRNTILIASSHPSTRRIEERRDVPEIAPSFISMPVELPPGVHGKFH